MPAPVSRTLISTRSWLRVAVAKRLRKDVSRLRFGPPVHHVYNPLTYAWAPHRAYLARFGKGRHEVLIVGMNPSYFGMVQTGVPFGDVQMVRDWLAIRAPVRRPRAEHPKRPIEGYACRRREMSGQRLGGEGAVWSRMGDGATGPPHSAIRVFFTVAGRGGPSLPAASCQ